ncbi:MAG: hypothetical protein AMJ69_03655 [Gammaproteobacteria bacterium SG8_47]|nr:MAG: hypothetical protein AMJ69_03655 [Gammaproteobacteria bacterium SG8_47]
MPFAYYKRLSRKQQSVYRKSDGITTLRLPKAADLSPLVMRLEYSLRSGVPTSVETEAQSLLSAIVERLQAPPVRVSVLTVRPHDEYAELHGLYRPAAGRGQAQIAVWMHTARRQRVVAFKTFLRTLLHELCHHLDYELLGLAESFHTVGFYKRESSLFKQLLAPASQDPHALAGANANTG